MSIVSERTTQASTTGTTAFPPVLHVKHETPPRWAVIGLIGLRLAVGFEFLWAFFDKTFGLGYSTPSAHAWLNGGSPTKGFLSGAIGPFGDFFHSIAGAPIVDWLFMLGLLGVGVALVLGVAVRPAAFFGGLMLALMWFAVWVPASTAAGQPTGSTNPFVDEHIVGIFALVAVAALVTWSGGYLGRTWSSLSVVRSHAWLR